MAAIERHGHPEGETAAEAYYVAFLDAIESLVGRAHRSASAAPRPVSMRAVLGVLLALSASLMWGFADYVGGLQTRSRQVLSVVLISQLAGLVVIACVVAGRGVGWPGAEAMLPAAVAGVIGAFAIVVFYLALSYGPVSIVAPVLASSACIPVVYGLVAGRAPLAARSSRASSVTLAGVILVSLDDGDGHARGRRGIGFGILAAVLLGVLLVIFSRAAAADAYWAPLVLRAVSIATTVAIVLVRARPRRASTAAPRARDREHRHARHAREPRLLASRRRCSCSRSPPC